MKKVLLYQLVILSFNFTCVGEQTTGVDIYNYKSDIINVYYKKSDYDELGIPEKTININPNSMSSIGGTAKVKPISEYLDYLIIKDKNNNNIMNLSGNTLDSAFKIVEETEYHITYRLDVN